VFNKIYEKLLSFIKINYKFLIFLTVLIFVFYYEFPYLIYKSGGTINLEERVEIARDYQEDGTLSMSYVTAIKGTIPFILLSYVIDDWDLIPMEQITGGNTDYQEVLETGKVYLNEGIDNAIIAAFNESNYNIIINKSINTVTYISGDADTDIEVGDILTKVDNVNVNVLEDVKSYVNTLKVGDIVSVTVIRDGKEEVHQAKVYLDSENTLKIGLAFKTTYEYTTEIPVTVKMKDNESGSSGGLMMSLAIYNALTEEDITHGLNIVGTGSINSDGTVDEIGGVKYKVLGAVKHGADLFFCPEENYEEAINIKEKRNLDIDIVSVSTLKDAINYLSGL